MIKGDIRVETIRVLHDHCGYSLGDLGKVFRISRVRIYQIMKANGISGTGGKFPRFTLTEWKEFGIKLMAELRRNRYSTDRIGKLIGISETTVFKIVRGHEAPSLAGSKGRLLKPEDIFSGRLPCYTILRKWVLLILPHVCSECGKDEGQTKKLYVVKGRKYPRSFLDFKILCHSCYFRRHIKLLHKRKILKKKARRATNG